MKYSHTQKAPLHLILWVTGIAVSVGAMWAPQRSVQIILLCSAALILLFAVSFQHLTVSDQEHHLLIAFGPLPLFRRRIRYADITNVERGRTSIANGWGIHWVPGDGWTWNLWGFDCVDVYLGGRKKVRIGTDDPQGLEDFLKEKVVMQRLGEMP